MEIFYISLVAFGASLLTFFSGFGLGTLLTPFMALFFPIEIAIALTGVVHMLNNLFKFVLMGKHTDKNLLMRFGSFAIIGALIGAFSLEVLGKYSLTLLHYSFNGKMYEITLFKSMIALLMLTFSIIEWIPSLKDYRVQPRFMPLGGVLSGFFGGLSGNQGALRSMFLLKGGLSKEAFIATGIAIALCVDITRLPVYFLSTDKQAALSAHFVVWISATIAAFAGAYLGNKLLKKVTLKWVQYIVLVGIIIIALALGAGWI